MKVLIAEDDLVTSQMLTELLRSWDYDVVAVRDGIEALKALTSDPSLQLAVLDWMMPGMDGPEVCRAISDARGDAPMYVILLTARRERADVIAGIEAGADDYLAKPFDPVELRARLYAGTRVVELQQRLVGHVEELQRALAQVQTLNGLLPICTYCKSIRDDSNYWHQVDEYMTEHANVRFTHGICPKCVPTASEGLSAYQV
jgi:DNA-binding response OmpR family regulator